MPDTPDPIEQAVPGEALIAGLDDAKGAVYLDEHCIQAAARVRNTGTPEIVETPGGRVSHLLIFRDENTHAVGLQRLHRAH